MSNVTIMMRDLDEMGESKDIAILLAAVDYSQTIHMSQVPITIKDACQLIFPKDYVFGTIQQYKH